MTDTATPQDTQEVREVTDTAIAQQPQGAPESEPAKDAQPRTGRNRRGRRGGGGGARQPQDAQAQPQPQQQPAARKPQQQQPSNARKPSPVLEKLFTLYPNLFGARFVPLKLGVYEDLLARHPEAFKTEDLKIAMGQHARSTRYLESVAAGLARHDLDGNALDPVAPEHVHHAILELHRRRSLRNNGADELRAQLVTRVARAIEASGLEREDYAVLVRSRDENNNAVVDEALAELAGQAAKREALMRAFEASGRSEAEFADMYGMKPGEVTRTLQRVRKDRKQAQAAAEAAAAALATAEVAAPADEPAAE